MTVEEFLGTRSTAAVSAAASGARGSALHRFSRPIPTTRAWGCGGLIAEACRQDLPGKVVIVSDGAGSHTNSKAYPPDRLTSLREEEANERARRLG